MESKNISEFNLFRGTVKSADPFWQRLIQILVIIVFWITILLLLPSKLPAASITHKVLHDVFGKGPP